MKEKIELAVQKIRPALWADGGDVELVGVSNGLVKVKLKGAVHSLGPFYRGKKSKTIIRRGRPCKLQNTKTNICSPEF